MTWYAIGAAIIVFMLTVNFAVFLFRRGSRNQSGSTLGRRLPAHESSVYAAMVAVCVVGGAVPYLWPDSLPARALAQPWALPCLVAWSMLAGLVLLVLMRVIRARRSDQES